MIAQNRPEDRRQKDPPSPDSDTLVLVTDANFDEELYLASNPDVARAVIGGRISSGRAHFVMFGRDEARRMRLVTGQSAPRRSWIRDTFTMAARLVPSTIKRRIKRHNDSRVRFLEERLTDSEVLTEQMLTILRRESNIPPPPPKHLQLRVVGNYSPDFIETGFTSIYPDLNRALEKAGRKLEEFEAILDFGCGCGRATRAFATLLPKSRLYGIDIDQEAIEWLQHFYSHFAEFSLAPHLPPTEFRDQMFDFVFGISVFTHLPEDMQFKWLNELSRILKARGYLILTTHGESFHRKAGQDVLTVMKEKGFYYTDFGSNYGRSISLPDFYQTAFHSHDYIRKAWGQYFEVVDIQPLGPPGHQDMVLLRNRS